MHTLSTRGRPCAKYYKGCCCSSIAAMSNSFCDLMDCRLSMGFSRQEYWSGLQFPSPGDLTDVGINPVSPALAGGFFTTEPPGKLHYKGYQTIKL